jgi:phage tail sheath protein FI
LQLNGKYDGAYANGLRGFIEAPTNGSTTAFNLTLKTSTGITLETFPNLVIGTANEGDANYVETVVNHPVTGSKYIEAVDLASVTASPNNLPALTGVGTGSALATGDDGLTGLVDADFVGTDAAKTGLRAFDLVDNLTLLAVPGMATSAIHNAMITYCEVTRDGQVFAILDPAEGSTAAAVRTYVTSTASLKNLSEHGLFYWPRWKITNPSKSVFGTADKITVPLSGHICGMYSRVDGRRVGGVYDVPAGPDFGKLFGLLEPETTEALDGAKNDIIFPDRINRVTSATGVPPYLDGARTLKENGNWPWANQRRGMSHIQKICKVTMDIYRHKGRDEELLAEEYRTLYQYLVDQCALGAFISKDPSKAFFLDMGGALNPRTSPNITRARIGVATKAPNEFIILSFSEDKSIGTT